MTRCLVLLATVLVPIAASAQGTINSWPGLAAADSMVYVLDDSRAEVFGRLLRLDADSLVVRVGDAERHFPAAQVRRIDRRGDSLRNGALIGAIVGAAIGLFAAQIADCPVSDAGGSCGAFRAAGVLTSTGIYAGIGTGIDALKVGRTTVYEAPTQSIRAAGMPDRVRPAVSMTLRW